MPMILTDKQREMLANAKTINICQAENPDGDSIGSALALEEILSDQGKVIHLHCPVQIPTYLRYIDGWDRISLEFNPQADMAIIVDTSAKSLMGKTLDDPVVMNFFSTHPVIVLDHHVGVEQDLPFVADSWITMWALSRICPLWLITSLVKQPWRRVS